MNGSRGIVVGWRTKADVIPGLSEELLTLKELEEFMTQLMKDARLAFLVDKTAGQIKWLRGSAAEYLPVVKFEKHPGKPHSAADPKDNPMVVLPNEFKSEVSGSGVCRRWQMPLKVSRYRSIDNPARLGSDDSQVPRTYTGESDYCAEGCENGRPSICEILPILTNRSR